MLQSSSVFLSHKHDFGSLTQDCSDSNALPDFILHLLLTVINLNRRVNPPIICCGVTFNEEIAHYYIFLIYNGYDSLFLFGSWRRWIRRLAWTPECNLRHAGCLLPIYTDEPFSKKKLKYAVCKCNETIIQEFSKSKSWRRYRQYHIAAKYKNVRSRAYFLKCTVCTCVLGATNASHFAVLTKTPIFCRQHFQRLSKLIISVYLLEVQWNFILGVHFSTCQHCFKLWVGTFSVPSHYLN